MEDNRIPQPHAYYSVTQRETFEKTTSVILSAAKDLDSSVRFAPSE